MAFVERGFLIQRDILKPQPNAERIWCPAPALQPTPWPVALFPLEVAAGGRCLLAWA
jgi:hypothetical protein